jgi:hypothetical protein
LRQGLTDPAIEQPDPQGMTSKKRGEIEEIVEAINRAIIERG